MMKHSQEERVHMAKVMEYVQERGGIVKMSKDEEDWATWNFLQWLVAEQREEEKLALDLLDKAELAGGATMSDVAKFELNKTIGTTGQDFPTADQINPLAE